MDQETKAKVVADYSKLLAERTAIREKKQVPRPLNTEMMWLANKYSITLDELIANIEL